MNQSSGNWIREWVAALLSAAIVGVTIYVIVRMFLDAPDVSGKLWQHQSAILQAVIGLTGTVTGYYFGRIPAEKAAATAQQAAATAQQNLQTTATASAAAVAAKDRVMSQVADLHQQMTSDTPLGGAAVGGDSVAARDRIAERLSQILRG